MKTSAIITRRLRYLRPILNRWIALNIRFSKEWEQAKDVPWWYNERASISVFAGAVWKEGGSVFEEYGEEKRNKHGKRFSGRIDLWFSHHGRDFWVEAKQCWPSLGKKRGINYIEMHMDSAVNSVKSCVPDGHTSRLAFVFGAPSITAREGHKAAITRLIDRAKLVEADAFACVFPVVGSMPKPKSKRYPGVMLWIKEVKRGLPT